MTYDLVRLGDVAEINPRFDRSSNLQADTQVRFVPMAAVDEVNGLIADVQHRPFSEVSKGYTNFETGDVLFAKITPCMQNGKSAIFDDETSPIGFGSTEFYVIRAGERILSRFIYHLVRQEAFREKARANFTGTAGQQRVPKDFLENYYVSLPPLDEQQRIVDILDRAASIQRLRQAADEKLKQIIPALFVDMFGDPATNPKGLPLVKLGDLIERIETGKNVTAGSGTSDYSILKVSAVTSGAYKEHESKPAPDDHMVVQSHIVRVGDFLFSRANTVDLVGATAIVQQTNGKTLLPDKLWRIRWRKDVDPRYMLAVMQNNEIRAELGRASSGTSASMRNISQGRLAAIEVPLASFEQQQQFGRIAEALTAKASLSQQASQHAQSAAASLTQSVFGS